VEDSGMLANKHADALGDVEEAKRDPDIERAIESGELDASEGTAEGDIY